MAITPQPLTIIAQNFNDALYKYLKLLEKDVAFVYSDSLLLRPPLRLELRDQAPQTPSFVLRKEQGTANGDQPLEARIVGRVARHAADLPGKCPFVGQCVVTRVTAPKHPYISRYPRGDDRHPR